MKNTIILLMTLSGLAILAQGGHGMRGQGGPSMGQANTCLLEYLATTPTQELSQEEARGLIHMREEEKLARDVYLYFADLYSSRIFSNIARSEQQHMDAVKALLDRYAIEDPVVDDSPGTFTDAAFDSLYQGLIAQGSESEVEALLIGAMIEDLDIADLQEELYVSDNEDVDTIYQNLMKGSRNHFRSFTFALSQWGETYRPQYLSQDEADAIIQSPMERGVVYDAEGLPMETCANGRKGGGRGRRG